MKALILDDELNSQEYLQQTLEQNCPEVTVLGVGSNIEEGYQLIRQTQPDLVFLDVEMPNGTGFDLLRRFDTINFEIIFVTGFDQYALNAIKFNCLDYILKPYSFEEVTNAVEKAKVKHTEKDLKSHMENLLYNLRQNKNIQQRIAIPTIKGLEFIDVDSVIYLEAEGKYTRFYRENEKSLFVSRNMKEYEAIFKDYGFFRVHRKHIINVNKIMKYNRGEGGTVVMKDGTNICVSKRRKEGFLARMNQHGN